MYILAGFTAIIGATAGAAMNVYYRAELLQKDIETQAKLLEVLYQAAQTLPPIIILLC